MSADTELATNMLARADADGLPADHHLRVLAHQFEAAAKGYFAAEQTIGVGAFMGAWARARRAWCAYTGESLL